jgi:hypothetical protein
MSLIWLKNKTWVPSSRPGTRTRLVRSFAHTGRRRNALRCSALRLLKFVRRCYLTFAGPRVCELITIRIGRLSFTTECPCFSIYTSCYVINPVTVS